MPHLEELWLVVVEVNLKLLHIVFLCPSQHAQPALLIVLAVLTHVKHARGNLQAGG